MHMIPPSWRLVYLAIVSTMKARKPRPYDQPSQWCLSWGRGFFLDFFALHRDYLDRQTPQVWSTFHAL